MIKFQFFSSLDVYFKYPNKIENSNFSKEDQNYYLVLSVSIKFLTRHLNSNYTRIYQKYNHSHTIRTTYSSNSRAPSRSRLADSPYSGPIFLHLNNLAYTNSARNG